MYSNADADTDANANMPMLRFPKDCFSVFYSILVCLVTKMISQRFSHEFLVVLCWRFGWDTIRAKISLNKIFWRNYSLPDFEIGHGSVFEGFSVKLSLVFGGDIPEWNFLKYLMYMEEVNVWGFFFSKYPLLISDISGGNRWVILIFCQ